MCAWFISHRVLFSRFLHISAPVRTSPFCGRVILHVCLDRAVFTHPPGKAQVARLRRFTVVRKPLWGAPAEAVSSLRSLGAGNSVFGSEERPADSSEAAGSGSRSLHTGSRFSTSSPALALVWAGSHPGVWSVSRCGLELRVPNGQDLGRLCTCIFLGEMSVQILCPFLYWAGFSLLSYKGSSFWTLGPYQRYDLQLFSCPWGVVFSLY